VKARRFYLIIVVLLLISFATGVLMHSRAMLQWTWQQVETFSHQVVTAQRIDGVLAGPINIEGLIIRTPSSDIVIPSAKFDWHPGRLLMGRLSIIEARASEVIVTLHPTDQQETSGSRDGVSAPLTMRAGELAVERFVIRREGANDININNIVIDGAEWRGERLWVDSIGVDSPWGSLSAHGYFATRSSASLDLNTRFILNRAFFDAPLELSGELTGTLGHPQLRQQLSGAARGRIDGEVIWTPGPLHWQAVADIEPFSLKRLRPGWRQFVVGGHLEGSGDFLRNELRGTLSLDDRTLGRWQGIVSLTQDHERIEIHQAQLQGRGHAAQINGQGEFRLAAAPNYVTDADLHLCWHNLVWPVAGHDEKVRSAEGTAHLKGVLRGYRLTTDLALTTPQLPPSRWQVEGKGDLHHFSSPSIRLQGLNGTATGEASILWSPHLEWHAHLDGKGLDPGAYWKQWPGRLDIDIRSDGRWQSTHSLNIEVQKLRGSLRGYPVTGTGRIDYLDGRWNIAALQLTSGSANFAASGTLLNPWNVTWQFTAPQLGQLLPGARGQLQAKGTISGSTQQPRLTLDISGNNASWKELRVQSATLVTDIDLSAQHPWLLRMQGTAIRWGDNILADELQIRGEGSAATHHITLQIERSDGRLSQAADGVYSEGTWTGTLHDGSWSERDGDQLRQESPAAITIGRNIQMLSRYCWTGGGEARGCVDYQPVQPGGQVLHAALAALPVQLLAQWLPRKDVHVAGKIFAEGYARIDGGLREVALDAHVESGALHYQHPLGRLVDLRFDKFTVSAQSKEGNSRALADIVLSNGDTMHLQGHLPGWSVGLPMQGNEPVEGAATLSMHDLSWMTLVVPEILDPKGVISAQLALGGRVDDPLLTGTLALENASVAIPRAGLSIKKMAIRASSPDGKTLHLSGAATSGPGWVTIEGDVRGESLDKWRSEFVLRGDQFESIRLPTVHLLASPQIHATIEPHRLDVVGTVLVPEANITLPELPSTVRVSSDVIVINGSAPIKQPAQWEINSRLTLQLGDYVRLEGYGFKGRIGGQLTVTEKPDALATGQGELSVYDGRYKAYGQDLTIEYGRMLFANSPIDNPALDVRASRSKDEVKVGVNITGRLQSPELRLFSEPAMEESDALAYLVLGHPLRNASSSEATSVTAAATSIGLVGGERIAGVVGKEFGIEEVSVGSEYQSKEAALLLGKYLSPRLYLQYAVVFSDALNITRLRYELANHWYIKAESGEQQSADILYTFER